MTLSYTGGTLGTGAAATWYDDASLTSSIATGNDVSITAPDLTTSYYVRFESDCDTTAEVSVTVTVFSIPDPEITDGTENACVDGALYRYIVSGQAGSSYYWNITGGTIATDNNDTVFVDWGSQAGTGSLSVIETSTEGCVSDPDSVEVSIGGPTIDLGEDLDICEGTATTIVPDGEFSTHMWLNNSSTAATYTTDTTELVRIQVFDDAGCTAFDSVQVTSFPVPVVDLGNDTTLCGETSLVLDAGNPGASYNWSTGANTQQIDVFPGEQIIWIEVTGGGSCTDMDTIMIRPCSPQEFFANIANTITPNKDGVNDTWRIDEVAAYPNVEIEIFDRWGTLVWKSTRGYSVEWDGRSSKGRDMPMGSYYYVINLNDGSDVIQGTITIIR
jgi:gliding motility-associated-like protein